MCLYWSRHILHSDWIFNVNITRKIKTIFMDNNIPFHLVFPWLGMHMATLPIRIILFWLILSFHVFIVQWCTYVHNVIRRADNRYIWGVSEKKLNYDSVNAFRVYSALNLIESNSKFFDKKRFPASEKKITA